MTPKDLPAGTVCKYKSEYLLLLPKEPSDKSKVYSALVVDMSFSTKPRLTNYIYEDSELEVVDESAAAQFKELLEKQINGAQQNLERYKKYLNTLESKDLLEWDQIKEGHVYLTYEEEGALDYFFLLQVDEKGEGHKTVRIFLQADEHDDIGFITISSSELRDLNLKYKPIPEQKQSELIELVYQERKRSEAYYKEKLEKVRGEIDLVLNALVKFNDVFFEWEGKKYSAPYRCYEMDTICLPDKTLLMVDVWTRADSKVPLVLRKVGTADTLIEDILAEESLPSN